MICQKKGFDRFFTAFLFGFNILYCYNLARRQWEIPRSKDGCYV